MCAIYSIAVALRNLQAWDLHSFADFIVVSVDIQYQSASTKQLHPLIETWGRGGRGDCTSVDIDASGKNLYLCSSVWFDIKAQ